MGPHPHDLCLTSFGCSAVFAVPFCSTTVSAGSIRPVLPLHDRCREHLTTCASHPLDARRCLRRPSARRPFLQGAPHDLCLTSFGCSAVFAAPFCSTTFAGSSSFPSCSACCGALAERLFARRVMRGMRKAALAGYRACVDGGQAPSHAREIPGPVHVEARRSPVRVVRERQWMLLKTERLLPLLRQDALRFEMRRTRTSTRVDGYARRPVSLYPDSFRNELEVRASNRTDYDCWLAIRAEEPRRRDSVAGGLLRIAENPDLVTEPASPELGDCPVHESGCSHQ